jgi:(p)ppGpp synthase/HD superfamily hydrolase
MPQTAKAYGASLYDAIELAARAHYGQVRKGTEIPYLVHPLAVAATLITAGCPEPVVIAGLLHDTLEDTPLTAAEIVSRFGRQVADWVQDLSEPDKKASWEARKAHTLEHLGQCASEEVLLISLADKLDNVQALCEGLARDGERFWDRFNRARDSQKWYYTALAGIFARRLAANRTAAPLVARFGDEVQKTFGRS